MDIEKSKRPLVLHVRGSTASGGGPEKTILNSPRFLETFGYRAICAYMHPPKDFAALAERAAMARAPFRSVPDRGPLDWRVVASLIRICRSEKVAIWHGHEYKSNLLGLIVKRFWPMKLITTVHGWVQHTRRTPLYYALDKLCLRYYDAVICVSQDLCQECLRVGIAQSRCHLIHNGIDTEEYRRVLSQAVAKRKLGVPAERVLIGAVGRLSPEKGFDVLIRAVTMLVQSGHNLCLWIAGEGEARPDLENLVSQLGCEDRVRLLGHVSSPKELFQALDVFVLSSLREGLPNVLLEAMSLEVPVVATRVAGVPLLIEDGENGLLVDAGSVDALVRGIERLLAYRELSSRFVQAARRTVERSYGFGERMRKVAAIYNRALGRNAAPSSRSPE